MTCAAIWLAAAGCCTAARADNELPCWLGPAGDYQIAVFQSPAPLRVGVAHYSLLVQDGRTGAWLADARADLHCWPHELPRQVRSATFSADGASNRLLLAATIDLPSAGSWDFQIIVTGRLGNEQVHFTVDVLPPAPRWHTLWPWFSWPIVPIALFAVHLRLAQAQRANVTERRRV